MAPPPARGGVKRVPPPPRDLNVQQFAQSRASELESLHAIVASRTNEDYRLPRGKRRRTTSFDSRIAKKKRRRTRQFGGDEVAGGEGEGKRMSRRARRKAEFRANPDSGFVVSADGTKRLRTHLWHAKRFTMGKRWGYFLPLGLRGSGRGSRAVLKWIKSGAVVHDASYYSPIQLEGSKDSLLTVMNMVLVPSLSDVSEELSKLIICGSRYGSSMLHEVGAPDSQFIAPVSYMWRSSSKEISDNEDKEDHIFSGSGVHKSIKNGISMHYLWIWIHAAALKHGYEAIRSACCRLTNQNGESVRCFSLQGKVANFELMGSKAIGICQKLLRPLPEFDDASTDYALRKCTLQGTKSPRSIDTDAVMGKCTHLMHCGVSELQKSSILKHVDQLPPHSMLSFEVHDPRDLYSKANEALSKSTPALDHELQKEDDDQINFVTCSASCASKEVSLYSAEVGQHAAFLSDCEKLWTSCDKLCPPVEESILCSKKHQRRMKSFFMDSNTMRMPDSENGEGASRSCPILLVKHSNQTNTFVWWSITLPITWAKAFWIPLISTGAHAIGLRERRWIACDNTLPFFPFDFPDCESYTLSMASEAAASDKALELRPLSVRPIRVPISPPWGCLKNSVAARLNIVSPPEDMHVYETDIVSKNLQEEKESENCTLSPVEGSGFSSVISVARTCETLTNRMKSMNVVHLLLFPNTTEEHAAFSCVKGNGRLECISKITDGVLKDRELCLVRVLLHAIKGGVFEDGALVCAPTMDDIPLMTSRSDEREIPQLSQSSVKSYFTEPSPGKWETQLPHDDSSRQSFRWPIGFVTTGFVRGSIKAVAVAFCEASLLAQVRAQQRLETPEKLKTEIFVLVRNLRSVAYRIARATIVLEQQKADLAFT